LLILTSLLYTKKTLYESGKYLACVFFFYFEFAAITFEQFKNLQWFHSMCLHNSEIIIDTQPIASIEATYVFQTTIQH